MFSNLLSWRTPVLEMRDHPTALKIIDPEMFHSTFFQKERVREENSKISNPKDLHSAFTRTRFAAASVAYRFFEFNNKIYKTHGTQEVCSLEQVITSRNKEE